MDFNDPKNSVKELQNAKPVSESMSDKPEPNSRPAKELLVGVDLIKGHDMEPQTRKQADEGEGIGIDKKTGQHTHSHAIAERVNTNAAHAVAHHTDADTTAAALHAAIARPVSAARSREGASRSREDTPRRFSRHATSHLRDDDETRISSFAIPYRHPSEGVFKRDLERSREAIGRLKTQNSKNQVQTVVPERITARTASEDQGKSHSEPLDWDSASLNFSRSDIASPSGVDNAFENQTRIIPSNTRDHSIDSST